MGNPGQRFQVNFFSEVQIYIIHYCVHTLWYSSWVVFFCCMALLGFSCCKIGGKEIGYLSDVAINAISLNKISYIPAQLFRASMKVLHSICNIFAFQMKNKCLQMTEEIKRQLGSGRRPIIAPASFRTIPYSFHIAMNGSRILKSVGC